MDNLARIMKTREELSAIEAEALRIINELYKEVPKQPSFLQWVKAQLPWLFAVACVILPFTQ